MRFTNAITITAVSLAAASSSPAHAVDCSVIFSLSAAACGSVSVSGGAVGQPMNVFANPLLEQQSGATVTVGAVGAGLGGVAASVSGTGTFGAVHMFASADNGSFTTLASNSVPVGQAAGSGTIGIVDGFSVGAAPVTMHLTSVLDGIFTGSGEAQATFILADGGFVPFSGTVNFTNKIVPLSSNTFDFQLMAGHDYLFSWSVHIFANSTNDGAVIASSLADVSNTGLLFIDTDTPLTFLSGHDYSSTAAAATPLPAALPLFASGLGALGLLGWRRKRKSNATVSA